PVKTGGLWLVSSGVASPVAPLAMASPRRAAMQQSRFCRTSSREIIDRMLTRSKSTTKPKAAMAKAARLKAAKPKTAKSKTAKSKKAQKTSVRSVAARALGSLPEWNLADLYPAMDAPEVKRDLDRMDAECIAFEEAYKGRLAEFARERQGERL